MITHGVRFTAMKPGVSGAIRDIRRKYDCGYRGSFRSKECDSVAAQVKEKHAPTKLESSTRQPRVPVYPPKAPPRLGLLKEKEG